MKKSVLITGASSGIGDSTGRHLAEGGWRVFGSSRRPHKDRDGIRFLTIDVRDSKSVDTAVQTVVDEAGSLDALICNAGMGIFGSVEEVSPEAALDQFETNYFGVLRVLRASLPHMRKAGSGRILLVGSLAGRTPIPFQSHYSSSKAAIDALSGSLYMELAPFGIHVSLIEPGDIDTPFNDAMHWNTNPQKSAYGEAVQRCEETIRKLLPEAPPPETVARCIERALSARRPRARYTVGASAWVAPIARRLLPDRLALAMIRRHFGL